MTLTDATEGMGAFFRDALWAKKFCAARDEFLERGIHSVGAENFLPIYSGVTPTAWGPLAPAVISKETR